MSTRMLVVEDNPANLELILYLLKAFGYDPVAAADGEKGVDTARRELPDLILCDIQLPGIDGYEVIRQVKKIPALQTVPAIAITAFAMVGDREKVLAAGFDGYISKPIAPETFIDEIETFLRPEQRIARPELHVAGSRARQSRRTKRRD